MIHPRRGSKEADRSSGTLAGFLGALSRVEFALKLEPLLRIKAKENLSEAGKKSSPGKPSQNSAKLTPADTRKELATLAALGVSKTKASLAGIWWRFDLPEIHAVPVKPPFSSRRSRKPTHLAAPWWRFD